jgi:uncharacterized protein YukE
MERVYVDPDELENFLQRLIKFCQEVETCSQNLRGALQRLQSTWRDQEYEKFVTSYEKTDKRLQVLIQEIKKVYPHIQADIEFIRGYFQQTIDR